MKQVKAIHATPENFKDFGVVTRLTDNDCFQGEGWKCWMTDDVCMDQPAHFGMTYVKTYPPYEVASMERHTKTKELMVCGEDRPIVVALANTDPSGHAHAEDVRAFIIEPGEILVINKGICTTPAARSMHRPSIISCLWRRTSLPFSSRSTAARWKSYCKQKGERHENAAYQKHFSARLV